LEKNGQNADSGFRERVSGVQQPGGTRSQTWSNQMLALWFIPLPNKTTNPNSGHIKEERFIDLTSEYRIFNDSPDDRTDPRRVGNTVNYHMDSQIDLIEINDGGNQSNFYSKFF
jgi:hypothetical protein